MNLDLIKCLIIFLIFKTNCSSQVTEIVPLRSLASEHDNGVYLKDIDNELTFYEGTWVGTLNDKKYTFEFVKFTQHLSQYEVGGDYYYRDDLMGKFKVEDLITNNVIYNDLSIITYEDFKIFLTSLRVGAYFSYVDKVNCFNSADFFLFKVSGNPNQLRYENFSLNFYSNYNCQYTNQEDIPLFLPMSDLILTRQ